MILIVAAGLSLLMVGTAFAVYSHLSRNITTVALLAGVRGVQAKVRSEKVDAFGRSPINVLLIGSDSRTNPIDCRLGGDCGGTGANADVEMVVHIAADRSNATVMSVPRDTMTQLPQCSDPKTGASSLGGYGQINSTLSYGPGCTVAAVQLLTGITIDHFAMVDFAGVVTMSDTVGGVSVCVSDNVYDPYSHLLLTRGTHNLQGLSALEFLRSRHAFGDGSDLGRTYAQHLFLTGVIRNLKSASTLTDPVTLYSLADAATKALTVDTGLGSIPSLIGLAADLNKVPPDRITFTTMQTVPDPTNADRVVISAAAQPLLASIIDDQALTSPGGATVAPGAPATASPTVTATHVPVSGIAVRVLNATGTSHRAGILAAALIAQGFSPTTSYATAASISATSTLQYGPGLRPEALLVAAALHLPAGALRAGPTDSSALVLTIGTDWLTGTTFAKGGALTPAQQAQALDQAHAQTAGSSGGCAPVSTQNTVLFDGVPMTPSRAYTLARETGVPLSAP